MFTKGNYTDHLLPGGGGIFSLEHVSAKYVGAEILVSGELVGERIPGTRSFL